MLMAALRSLSILRPHSQRKVLSRKERSSLTVPQAEQVLEVGSHWLSCRTVLPVFCATYLRVVKKSAKPRSLIFLPQSVLHGFDIEFFKAHDVVFFAQVVGKLPVVVPALVGYTPMHSGEVLPGTVAVIAAFLLVREITIGLLDMP